MKQEEESMKRRASVGEVETIGRCIDSASSERGGMATGGLRRGGAPEGRQ
jgi:hypothetical protein